MFRVNGLALQGVGANAVGPPLVGAFLQGAATGDNEITYTFTGQSFGAAAADRRLILGIGAIDGADTNTPAVTIGGVAAALVGEQYADTYTGLFGAHVPAGTSGSVVITFGSLRHSCQISLYRVTGMRSDAQLVPVSVDERISQPASPQLQFTVNEVAGGLGIGAAYSDDNQSMTWGGGYSRNYNVGDSTRWMSSAIKTILTPLDPSVVPVTWSGAGTGSTGVLATFR